MTEGQREANRLEAEGNSLRIMGGFFGVFGLVLWVAILFTHDFRGQMTDFATGVALAAVGAVMYFRGRNLLARISARD